MTTESKAFEKLNTRITALINGREANVIWNGQLPDPDCPSDLRQIDVLVEAAGGTKISVECRKRSGAQSVMWIEELAGRKISLGLDGMIAVSINGFSALARTKAKRFGIILYDYDTLSDAEIASWPRVVKVFSEFVQFNSLEILAGVRVSDEASLAQHPQFRHEDKDGYMVVMDRIRDEVAANPGVALERKLDPRGFAVDGVPLTLLRCRYSGKRVSSIANCVSAEMVGHPDVPTELRDISVQKFDHTVGEIITHGGEAHLQIDVSSLQHPENSILHEFRIEFPAVTTVSKYELVGNRRLVTTANAISLDIATTA